MAAQREWFDKDYYAVLGVTKDASEKDIARAYKKLAKQYHPDANQGNPAAEERFKEVSAAYDVLGDKEKKSEYDEVRRMVASGVGPGRGGFGGAGAPGDFTFDFGDFEGQGGGLGDLFGNLFNRGSRGGRAPRQAGPQRGQDLETALHLSFVDAVHGVTSTVRFRADATCETCHGNGARPGTRPETCPQCAGTGSIAVDQGPFSFSQMCPRCGGRGTVIHDPCPTCKGRGVEVRAREVKVRVPAGVEDGQRIRVKGRGGAGINGGPAGDLYVVTHVTQSDVFTRKGDHFEVEVPITVAEALGGAEVDVPTLNGTKKLRVAPGTKHGTVQRLRGEGAPILSGSGRGDLHYRFVIDMPSDLTAEQREAVAQLSKVMNGNPRERILRAAGRS